VQIVVQQAAGGGVAVGRVGSGQGAGVLVEQVVQLVTAGRGLIEQVLVIQLNNLAVYVVIGLKVEFAQKESCPRPPIVPQPRSRLQRQLNTAPARSGLHQHHRGEADGQGLVPRTYQVQIE